MEWGSVWQQVKGLLTAVGIITVLNLFVNHWSQRQAAQARQRPSLLPEPVPGLKAAPASAQGVKKGKGKKAKGEAGPKGLGGGLDGRDAASTSAQGALDATVDEVGLLIGKWVT